MPGSSQDKTTIIESMLEKILARLNEPKKNFSEILDELYSYGEYLKETRFNTFSAQKKSLIKKGKKVISLTQESGFREHIKKIIVNQDGSKESKKKILAERTRFTEVIYPHGCLGRSLLQKRKGRSSHSPFYFI